MAELTDRKQLIPEPELPDVGELIAEGRRLGKAVSLGRSAFQDHYGVASEAEYKRRCAAEGRIMLHAHIGYRDPERTRRALAQVYEALDKRGYRLDRTGICFDRSMGYPPAMRRDMPKGMSLILDTPEEWQAMTRSSPAAPHFGDHMIGMHASVENAMAALEAGATTMGNISHYFSHRVLYYDDEVGMAASTVKALALVAAQPVEVLIHSNQDDGFGPLFADLACCLGVVLIEKHIVGDLLGAIHAPIFGNMFVNPLNRMAYQRVLRRITDTPCAMVYGNTSSYGPDHTANRAVLATYLTFDIAAQRLGPTGHAVTPVPITEYERIPEPEEIIEAQVFGNRLIERTDDILPLIDLEAVDAIADRLIEGGRRFKDNAFRRFTEVGIDTENPLELLLAVRRAGARRLEAWFGPGEPEASALRGRRPVLGAENLVALAASGSACAAAVAPEQRAAIRARGLVACVATSDIHEFGKIMVEHALRDLDVDVVDGGVSADPDDVVLAARDGGADFIALCTNNGIALTYLTALREEMTRLGLDIPVFVGGRLNQLPEGSNTGMPVDVSGELADAGARVCGDVGAMLDQLAALPGEGRRAA